MKNRKRILTLLLAAMLLVAAAPPVQTFAAHSEGSARLDESPNIVDGSKKSVKVKTSASTGTETSSTRKATEEVVRLTNEERAKVGLPELIIDEEMMDFAAVRAKETSTKFSHTRPDGSSIVEYGYGENATMGTQRGTAAKAVDSWMNSPGHKKNMLLKKYQYIGVGVYQAEDGTYYWVQLFAY